MKKVLALVLALVLAIGMTTVAFAVTVHPATAGLDGTTPVGADGRLYPGETYYLTTGDVSLNSKDYSVSAKWTKGGAMVASVSIDNAKSAIKLKMNENYSLEDMKDLVGTITLVNKKGADGLPKNDKVEIKINATVIPGVSNDGEDLAVYDNWDDAENGSAAVDCANTIPRRNVIYTADDSGKVVFSSETSLIRLFASMKKDQKVMLTMDEDTEYDVIDYLDDKGIDYDDLAFYNLKGKFNFASGRANAEINSDFSKKPYIYTWDGSKLTDVSNKAKWEKDDSGVYTVPVTGPTQYVLSNKALIVEKETEPEEETNNTTTTNPDTGANDFVGLAVALAVVSVAGIAVAKKH